MDEPRDDHDIVSVSTNSIPAISEPRFIIKIGEKYYLTLGTWEYELSKATTPKQREGCERIVDIFNHESRSGQKGEAVVVAGERSLLIPYTAIHPNTAIHPLLPPPPPPKKEQQGTSS